MNEVTILFIVFTAILLVIIILLFFERTYLLESHQKEKERLLDELSKSIKAVIAKNANDYVMTTAIDRVPKEDTDEAVEEDEVPLDAVSDDDFDKALGITRKPPKK